jgi:tripartite-type tricarboxylate transporter receptor subunit TctC
MKIVRAGILHAAAAFAFASFAAAALAQTYPTRPIRLIVPFEPAGTTDIIARVVADKLPLHLGQNIIVDNRSGAGGAVGAELLAKAEPDGYTLGVATVSTIATGPAMDPKGRYNPLTDFTPISNLAATPNVLVVHPKLGTSDYKTFIAELKKRPDHYAFASSGEGGLGHMLMALFQSRTGTTLLHVAYKGGGPAMNALVSGEVLVMIANLPTALPHIRAGRLVALAVAADEDTGKKLKVPTFQQLGYPDVNRVAFYGICGPRHLPRSIVNRVHAAIKQSLQDPQVRQRIENTGSVVIGNSPEDFRDEIRAELYIYKRVVATQKLRH